MRSIAPIAGRLAKLIRMLSSTNTGELAATASALMRTLTEAGADIHDLANAIEGGSDKKFSEADAQEIYNAGFRDGQRIVPPAPPRCPPSWLEIVEDCYDALDALNDREREFVQSVRRRIHVGEEPTEKQAKWLRDIYRRNRRNGQFRAI